MTKQISIFRTNIRHCLTETPDDAQSEKRLRFTEKLYFYTFGSAGRLKITRQILSAETDTKKLSSPNALDTERVLTGLKIIVCESLWIRLHLVM